MKNYKTLVTEVNKSTIVVGFGRLNPPTSGHSLLIQKLIETAKSNSADYAMFISRTQDKKKNPLPVDRKLFWAKKSFPGANIVAANEKIRTIIEVAAMYSGKYRNFVMVAGSDRVNEFQTLLGKYNGKEFQFDSIEVVSAGERDPDADGAEGMSASKMRAAASQNDFASFKKGVSHSLSDADARKMFQELREHMGIKSVAESIFQVSKARNAYYLGKTFLVGQTVKEGDEYFEILHRGSNHLIVCDSEGNMKRKFIDSLQVSEDVSVKYKDSAGAISFKGFVPSDAFRKNDAAVSAFNDTISRYHEGKITDAVAILRAMRNADELCQRVELIVGKQEHEGDHEAINAKLKENYAKIRDSLNMIGEFEHHRDYINNLLSLVDMAELSGGEEMAESMETPIVKQSDKLKVAKIIADALGVDSSGSNAETLVNNALRVARKKALKQDSIAIIGNMLDLAKEVGIKYEKSLVPVGLTNIEEEADPEVKQEPEEDDVDIKKNLEDMSPKELIRFQDLMKQMHNRPKVEEPPQKIASSFASTNDATRLQKVHKLMGHD